MFEIKYTTNIKYFDCFVSNWRQLQDSHIVINKLANIVCCCNIESNIIVFANAKDINSKIKR